MDFGSGNNSHEYTWFCDHKERKPKLMDKAMQDVKVIKAVDKWDRAYLLDSKFESMFNCSCL